MRGRYTYRYAGYAGATGPCRFISFLLFSPVRAEPTPRPDGAICRRSSVGRARIVPGDDSRRWFEPNRLHHRRDLLPRSRTERKPAEVVFPARCTKAAGRSNLFIGWHRLCKDERMRPTYRRRAVKFRGWSGYHRAFEKSEAWMWCGGGCLRTKPLCRTGWMRGGTRPIV